MLYWLTHVNAGELLNALLGDNAVRDRHVLQLFEAGSNPNQTLDPAGLKPIHVAVLQRSLEILRGLLGNRADVNARTSGFAPLHLAAQMLFLDGVKELLEQTSVLVNVLSVNEGWSPLMMAIATYAVPGVTDEERASVVRCIVEDPRCELDKADGDGWVALTYAGR